MSLSVLRVAWYRFRATFGHQRGGYLGVAVLIALIGGLAMGAMAGARRTASSFPTYLASTNPATTTVFTGLDDPSLGQTTGYNPQIDHQIAHLHLVAHSVTTVGFDGSIDLGSVTGIHPHPFPGETPPVVIGGLNGEYTTQDRVTLVDGRLENPNRVGEAVMNAQTATQWGLHIGSVIALPFYTDDESNLPTYNGPPHLVAKVKIVGEVVLGSSVVQDDIEALGSGVVLLSPAMTRELAPCCAYYSAMALQVVGGDANTARVQADVGRIFPLAALGIGGGSGPSAVVTKAQRAIKPEAVALGVFGALAGLAVVLIAGLLIGRTLRTRALETATLRALGAGRAMTLADGLAGLLGAVLVGSLLAVVVAVGLSPLTPLGPVRPVYPHPGVAFDWTVLGFGLLALVVVLGSLATALAMSEVTRLSSEERREAGERGPGLVHSVAAAGFPVAAVTGLRFALESGRGRNAAPVRAAILGAVLAVVVLVTTVTFGSSLDSLVSHPALYGWNWNYALLSGFAGQEDLPQAQIATLLNGDRAVEAWSGVNFVGAKLDGQGVKMLAERPGASVAPPLLSGHGLASSDQIVLGPITMAALHKHLGDTIILSTGRGRSRRLRIVGTATMATITKGLEMGTGALVATSDFPGPLLNVQQSTYPGPNAVLVRLRAGAEPSAYRSLQEITTKVNAIPDAGSPAGGVVSVLRPAEIANYRSMGTAPAILGVTLAVGAVVALGLTLVASVRRRRRDLALLKTLGLDQRQLAAVVAWQSSIAVTIGVILGTPLGVVLGRFLWDQFAHEISAVPAPSVPALSIGLVVVGALVLANVVAAIPGRMAARTPTAILLRSE